MKKLILTTILVVQLFAQSQSKENPFEHSHGGYSLSPNTLPHLLGMYLKKGGQHKINPTSKQETILEKQFEKMVPLNQKIVKEIKHLELELMNEVVYNNKNSNEVSQILNTLVEKKLKLMDEHINCINLLQNTLNEKQYKQLLEIAKEFSKEGK